MTKKETIAEFIRRGGQIKKVKEAEIKDNGKYPYGKSSYRMSDVKPFDADLKFIKRNWKKI